MSVTSTLRAVAKRAIESCLSAAPARSPADGRLILSYHNVVRMARRPLGDDSLHLDAEQFMAQLKSLRAEADVVTLPDLLAAPRGRGKLLAITFDDAYASALQIGVAACVAANMPCTVFVAPALLDTVPWWDRESLLGHGLPTPERDRVLWRSAGIWPDDGTGATAPPPSDAIAVLRIATAEEIRAVVQSPLVRLGNHTMSHVNLGAISTPHAIDELMRAQRWLVDAFPGAVDPIVAYPYGIAPTEAADALAGAGLATGLRVTGGWMTANHHTPWAIPRLNVPAGVSLTGFRARLRGWTPSA